ncbi:hypothetical protein WKW80_21255 [Variovorax humicola]|uniref:2,3-bisphosphoglycerate-dependent phosphoglycerate mutase n=1 Tax=Variovorax humicola TaxID=1769758 RepID=A0ABU8W393_9BURK
MNKTETASELEDARARIRRMANDMAQSLLPQGDARYNAGDPRRTNLTPDELQRIESLRGTGAQVLPSTHEKIVRAIGEGERVIVLAHGNSPRELIRRPWRCLQCRQHRGI